MAKAKHREYGQIKKSVGLVITDDALDGLDEIAQAHGVSRSHLVELIGRKQLTLIRPETQLLGE